MVKAQEFIKSNYLWETTEIKADSKNLEGVLDLREYKKLKKLEVHYNKITSLNLTECPNLEYLDIGGNLIKELDLSKNLKLKLISVSGLAIKQDLNTFAHLKELEHLCLDSSGFYGSLRPLSNTNLKKLYLRNNPNPNINESWEFLPNTLQIIECDNPIFFLNYLEKFFKLKKENDFLINEMTKKDEDIEDLASELLEIKRKKLEQMISEAKSKLDDNLHDYLDILLLSPDKSIISEKAKKNLINKLNNNDLQTLVLLQHQANHLEKKINKFQQVAQIETLPPYHF